MGVFKDNLDRQWVININMVTIENVRSSIDYDLLACNEDGALICVAEFMDDPVKLVQVAYVLVEHQIKEAGLSDEQFAEGMLGVGQEGAYAAILEGLANFFPNPKRDVLLMQIKKQKEAMEALMKTAMRCFEDGKFERAVESQKTRLEKQYGKTLESLASLTLVPERGARSVGQ